MHPTRCNALPCLERHNKSPDGKGCRRLGASIQHEKHLQPFLSILKGKSKMFWIHKSPHKAVPALTHRGCSSRVVRKLQKSPLIVCFLHAELVAHFFLTGTHPFLHLLTVTRVDTVDLQCPFWYFKKLQNGQNLLTSSKIRFSPIFQRTFNEQISDLVLFSNELGPDDLEPTVSRHGGPSLSIGGQKLKWPTCVQKGLLVTAHEIVSLTRTLNVWNNWINPKVSPTQVWTREFLRVPSVTTLQVHSL